MKDSIRRTTLLFAILIAAAVAVFILLPNDQVDDSTSGGVEHAGNVDTSLTEVSLRGTSNAKPPQSPSSVESDGDAARSLVRSPWTLEITVLDQHNIPVTNRVVPLQLLRDGQSLHGWTATTDDEGVARFPNVNAIAHADVNMYGFRLVVRIPSTLPGTFERDIGDVRLLQREFQEMALVRSLRQVTVRRTVHASGDRQRSLKVTTLEGVALPGIYISAFPTKLDVIHVRDFARTDKHGRVTYSIPDDWRGTARLLMGGAFKFEQRVTLSRANQGAISLAPSISGRIIDRDGYGVAGTRLRIRLANDPLDFRNTISFFPDSLGGTEFFWPLFLGSAPRPLAIALEERSIYAVSDDNGSFAFAGLMKDERYEIHVLEPGGVNRLASDAVHAGDTLGISTNTSRVTVRMFNQETGEATRAPCYATRVWRAPTQKIDLRGVGRSVCLSTEQRACEATLPVGSMWLIGASVRGYKPTRILFTVPDEERVRVDFALTPREKVAPLRVYCRTTDGVAISNLPLMVTQPNRVPVTFDITWDGNVALVHFLDPEEAQFRLDMNRLEACTGRLHRFLMRPSWPRSSKDEIAKGGVHLDLDIGGRVECRIKFTNLTWNVADARVHIKQRPVDEATGSATDRASIDSFRHVIPLQMIRRNAPQDTSHIEYAFESNVLVPGVYDLEIRNLHEDAEGRETTAPPSLHPKTTIEVVKGKTTPVHMSIVLPEQR